MSIACQHGQLARQCPLCEKDAEIATLRARVAELEAAQAWRPIESAPKDDLVVVKFDPELKLPPITAKLGCLVTHVWANGKEKIYNDPRWKDSKGLQIHKPTHWMPLPKRPEES